MQKAIRKIASGAIGLLMTGATLTGGALAADLATFDTDFTTSNTLIVVGSQGTDAAGLASDVAGAINIGAKLGNTGTSTTTTIGGGTVTVTGGATEEIMFGFYIGDSGKGGFDQELDDGDISTLQDTSITFQSTSYDVQDQIYFNGTTTESKGPNVRTSLNSSDDDYASSVYMEVERGAIGYYYIFDKAINISKATTSDPLKIEFLGATLKIVSVGDANTFTAYVGEEVFLNSGDSATIEGKTVTLDNVASGTSPQPVIVTVDGVTETVSGTETVNGIQITVDETFYSDTLAERSATLVMGETSSKTYNDGDAYIGEDTSNPDWVWDVDGLNSNAVGDKLDSNADGSTSEGPTLGVINKFVKDDSSDNPITVGGAYEFPGGQYKVSFDSLTVADDSYTTLTVEYDASSNLDDVYSAQTSEPAIYIHTTASEGLSIKTGSLVAGGLSSVAGDATKTDKIWLSLNDSNATNVDVFYEDTNNNVVLAGAINTIGASDLNFAEINYGKTKATNIGLDFSAGLGGAGNMTNITLDIMDDNSYLSNGADDIIVRFSNSSTEFNKLGDTLNTEESDELLYGNVPITIGTKDEDHRTLYGIVIKDPKSNGASDEAEFSIPSDTVKANLVVSGAGATVVSGTETTTWTAPELPSTGVSKVDSEVTAADKQNKNLILVGGPVVNSLVAELAAAGKTPNTATWRADLVDTAIVQAVDNAFATGKMALVVAGYEKEDTRAAATAVQAGGMSGAAIQIANGVQSAYTMSTA